MLSLFDNLDRRPITSGDVGASRQRDLREADRPGVGIVRRSEEHERLDHDVGHVRGSAVGAVGAVSQVDLQLSLEVAAEPAGLEGDGAAGGGPVRSVPARPHAAA